MLSIFHSKKIFQLISIFRDHLRKIRMLCMKTCEYALLRKHFKTLRNIIVVICIKDWWFCIQYFEKSFKHIKVNFHWIRVHQANGKENRFTILCYSKKYSDRSYVIIAQLKIICNQFSLHKVDNIHKFGVFYLFWIN